MLIDVHTHIDDEQFKDDLPEVLDRAKKAGVVCLITNGVNRANNMHILSLAKHYPLVRVAFGLYPTDAAKMTKEEIDADFAFIEEHASAIIAIGEVGMDYHWSLEGLDMQCYAFEKAIALAKKLDKPLICHSRKAEADTIDMLEKHHARNVVLHAFGGKSSLAKKAFSLGYSLSVPVNVVRSQSMQEVVKFAPLTQLLTETDGPYLGPVKDERNEPANMRFTVKKIAELRMLSEAGVEQQLFENARRLFGERIC